MAKDINTIEGLMDTVDARLRANMDFLIVIDGHKGLGKSTLAYWLAKHKNPEFTLERNFVFKKGKNEIEDKFGKLKKYSKLVLDEAQRNFYHMEFMSPEQNAILKFYNESRKANICTIFCSPKFMKLRGSLREVCDMRIYVVARGIAVIFMPVENPVNEDEWLLKECAKVYSAGTKGKRDIRVNDLLKIYSSFPTYTGVITWEPMPEDDEKEYLRLDAVAKEEARMEENDPMETRKDFVMLGRALKLLTALGVTQKAIAEFLRASEGYVNNALATVKGRKKDENHSSFDAVEHASKLIETKTDSPNPFEVVQQ